MKTIIVLFISALIASLSRAALPEGTQVIQAEEMARTGEGWTVREHVAGSWYVGRPVGKMLGGQNDQAGKATIALPVPAAGKYRLWIRYLDMVNYRTQSAFLVSATQQGREIARKEFDSAEASPRSTPEGEKKWGGGFAQWIWDYVEIDAAAGELQVAIEKVHLARVHDCTRTLDALLLTSDLQYEPQVTDLTPLYLKVRMLAKQADPVVIHFWGRRPFEPWYTPHANINKNGMVEGIFEGSEDQPGIRMAAGEQSGWVDVAPYLAYGGLNQISLYAMRSYYQPEPNAHFEVSFSKTPSDAGFIKKMERSGPGDGMVFAVDLAEDRLVTEQEGSAASLEMAKAAPEVAGKLPTGFPFFTGMKLSETRSTAEAIAREREALARIGISGDRQRLANHYFHLTKTPGCLSQPDVAKIDESMRQLAEKHPDRSRWAMLDLMDEPGFEFDHVKECPACQGGFAKYLRDLGLAEKRIDKLKLSNDPQNGGDKMSYYYTRRYMNHLMTEMLRVGTQSAQKHLPGMPTTSNFACELISGNLVSRSVDWFEILESGALTYGWNEDWAGWGRSRQINGYYVDVMRAACRKRGLDFGIYNILAHTPWEIEAHGFLEIGHGVRSMSFFEYGPYYAISSDTNSHRPEIYGAIKRIAYPTGAVETDLLASKPVAADVAQLLSVTGDIWHATRDNAFGRERAWLNLLLRHCNVRCEVLSEDDLATHLANYKMLFVTDANLKRAAVPPLVKWVRDGGVLYASAGALARDEFDAPLGIDEALGLHRRPLDYRQDPGRSEYEMRNLKNLGNHAGIPRFSATQEPQFQSVPVGKGKVIVVGFFPGISYIATSERPDEAEFTILNFESAHREWMNEVLAMGNIRPRLRTNNYRVEANLLEGPAADIIALSNWTGEEQTIVVQLDDAPEYSEIASDTAKILSTKNDDGSLGVELRMAAGAFLHLKKAAKP